MIWFVVRVRFVIIWVLMVDVVEVICLVEIFSLVVEFSLWWSSLLVYCMRVVLLLFWIDWMMVVIRVFIVGLVVGLCLLDRIWCSVFWKLGVWVLSFFMCFVWLEVEVNGVRIGDW